MGPRLSTPAPLLGTVLASRYEIRALLGRGGMGEVYEAVDRQLDRTVALKVLRPELAADRRFLVRFRREARTSARLSHPGIVAVHDVGEDEGRAFIVMEYVPGRTLGQIVRDEGAVAPARAARIGAAAADALAHAHDRGVVHRDVSPGNVMVTPDGEVKVLDFGIARAARGSARSGSPSAHGTVAYVAPEQARGEASDQRADVYALGAVLYELLTGRPPFEGATTVDVIRHVGERTPAPVSTLRPDVGAQLDGVIGRCLAKDPSARWVRADELATALRDAATSAPERAHSTTAPSTDPDRTAPLAIAATAELPPQRSVRAPRRRRRIGRIVSFAALATMTIGGLWLLLPALASMSDPVRPRLHGPRPVPVPSGLSVATSCDGFLATRAELAWTPGGPSKGYEIYRHEPGVAGYTLIARIDDWHATSYVDTSLGVDITYKYRMRAVNGPRVSRPSREAVAPTPLFCLA